MVTVAPDTTAPVGSVTVPSMPLVNCAQALEELTTTTSQSTLNSMTLRRDHRPTSTMRIRY